MKHIYKFIFQFLLLCITVIIFSCHNADLKSLQITSDKNQSVKTSNNCDYNLWAHVYNPDRLKIIDTCKMVTGTITESNADDDGDQHMLLKLDPGEENLLTPANTVHKNGCLVIEAICVNNISRNKVGDACEGFLNNVDLPRLNQHVKVFGSYVIDSHNGWAEIHPISSIDLIKNKNE